MPANEFEQLQRNKKVAALTTAIDRLLIKCHKNPHDAVAEVAGFTREQWASLAILAAIKPPSKTTQEQVIAIYRDRAKPPPDWPF